VLGRDRSADLVLPDPECSRAHAALTIEHDGSVLLEDLGSTNGTVVEGEPLVVGVARALAPGDLIQAGSSLLEVVEPSVEPLPLTPQEGRLGLHRRFRAAPPTFPERVELPRPPVEQDLPPLNLLLTLAPAVALAATAVMLGQLMFLVFAAISPLLGIGRAASQRRRHRRDARRAAERYCTEAAQTGVRLRVAVRAERDSRRFTAPDLAELALHARLPGRRLWERQPGDPDFLEVRVGVATQPSTVTTVGEADLEVPPLWQAPVTVRLPEVGNLSILGPRHRSRAVAAGLVMQLAIRGAPSSLRIVVLTDLDGAPAWEWATWLPHCRWSAEDRFRLVGSDPISTRARLAELLALIKQRRDRQRDRRGQTVTLPAVLVVMDDASVSLAEGFAEVLSDGPAVGVHAICLDEVQVPTQCRASLGGFAEVLDEAVLDHHGRSPASGVLVDLPDPVLLDQVGWSLAPLVALGEAGQGELPQDLRLLDVSGCTTVTPEVVGQRWATGSPSPGAVVGLGVEGPVSLDLTLHGPHGLIAGTTRSGKSEFIKTYVAALALANHPDDMAFLFIDFKGGADYRVLMRLPHAVELSTSEDLADFARTTRLLEAEIGRRRRLFDQAATTTIEGYRTARRARPELPPVGRLVVVVDEFAELVSRAPAQLEQLVSVARTGAAFGVHLLLATQRPAGAVTGQIDANVALRVCFRVAKPEESQDVIGAPDAADIAQRHRGRAFFRAHSEPLVEFQCARVGGARPGSEAGKVSTEVELLVWHELGRIPPTLERAEAPDHDTDLWDVAEACRQAAAHAGWTHQAVPWPKALPAVLNLEDLPPVEDPSLVPMGVADDADAQRHRAVGLRLDGGHVAVAGAPGTGRTTALRTAAVSLAQRCSAADAHLYLFDFAGGGLRPLTELPHCGGSAFDDWEQASRLVKVLTEQVAGRLELFARHGLSNIADQRASGPDPLPYLVVLIDGWDVIADEGSRLSLPEDLAQLLARGLATGVRAVVAGDRTVALGRLGRAIGDRYVLRFNEESDYLALGVAHRQVPASMPPGRAVLTTTGEAVQIAEVGGKADAASAIRDLARRCRERDAAVSDRWPRRVEPLPRQITLEQLRARGGPPPGAGAAVPLGLGGDRSEARWVDLAELAGSLVVAGPPGSGRTTALRAMARTLSEAGVPLALVTPRASPLGELAQLPGVVAHVTGPAARRLDLEELGGARVVLIDDVELIEEDHEPHADLLADPATRSVVVAGDLGAIADASRGPLALAKRARTGLVLSPRNRYDGSALGARFPDELIFSGPPGRAVAGVAGTLEVVQIPLA
jgi:S-DNA-T family DNA segregation ATPase FtsK/SpoIIIE